VPFLAIKKDFKMRILVIGNDKSSEILTNYLAQNKDNLIFCTKEETDGNFINTAPEDIEGLKEFALANEINLTIVSDVSLFEIDYLTLFNENGLTIFAPDKDAQKIAASKSAGKKFMYKNKIKTPRFAFFEKSNLALEHIKNAKFPVVIKPDTHSPLQAPFIAETYAAAKNKIDELFLCDNKKVLIEEYTDGAEVSFYVLSDGFNPVVIDFVKTYREELFIKGASLDKNLQEKIYNEIIFPTISSLAEDGNEYTGVLGFDIIITPEGEPNLIEYNSFFKDYDIEIMLEGTDVFWPGLLTDAIVGTLHDKFEGPFSIQKDDKYRGAFPLDNEIITDEARTLNLLYDKLVEEGLSEKTLMEAKKSWSRQLI